MLFPNKCTCRMRSRGSKVSVTRGGTRSDIRSRELAKTAAEPLKREKTNESIGRAEWPDPGKVIERDKEIQTKKDKIKVSGLF